MMNAVAVSSSDVDTDADADQATNSTKKRIRTTSFSENVTMKTEVVPSSTSTSTSKGRHNLRSKAIKSKYMEVPLYIKVVELMEQIGKIIGIDLNHLVLYIIALVPGQTVKDIDREDLYSCRPITLLSTQDQQLVLETTLNDVIVEQKIVNRPSTKYAIFYKVLPYALYDLQLTTVLKKTQRFTDFIIVDERLRYWRRLYLGKLLIE